MSRASASRRSWCARCCARSRSCAPPACRSCWSSRTRAPRCRSPTTGMCSRPARRCSRAAPPSCSPIRAWRRPILALLAPDRTVPAMLRRAAERYGERPLVTIAGGAWRHRDAAQIVARRAGALRAVGVERGDRVAIMCSNRMEMLEVFLACGWLGAIAVPINTASMRPQIEYYLANSGAKLLVLEPQFLARLPSAAPGRRVTGESYPPSAEPLAAAPVAPGETLAILYTSGTTGPAKGVTCPHAQYYWWGVNTAAILGVGQDDVLCTTLPLFHINALNSFAQAALMGCCVAFESQFSASRFWTTMHERGATVIYLLGAMVPILLSQPPNAAERSHRVRIGLGPGVPAAALEAFHGRTGITLLEGYGSTETNFVIATSPETSRRGVMGRLRPGFHARVVDEHDVE